eukprot:GILI01034152.1.p1 GENE.GILI01034152.1~~GILI01034152.1.p1  ORF type:complete len:145 (+),score=17.58 GILI01034152.1:31-435(+)
MSSDQPLVGALLSLADSILALDQKISSFMSTTNARLAGVEGRLLQIEKQGPSGASRTPIHIVTSQPHQQPKSTDITCEEIAVLETRLALLRKARSANVNSGNTRHAESESSSETVNVRRWIDHSSNATSNTSNN